MNAAGLYEKLNAISARPRPFEYYTTDVLWTDPHIAKQMLKFHLDQSTDAASRKLTFVDRSVDWLGSRLGVGQGFRIADFGCGPGLYATRLAAKGARVTGIDFSEGSLRYAEQSARSQGFCIDFVHANYLEYTSESRFDAIIMIYCDFCALSASRRSLLLRTFTGHLADGGVVVLDVSSESAYAQRRALSTYGHVPKNGFWAAEDYYEFLASHNAVRELSKGLRSGKQEQIVRLNANRDRLPPELTQRAREIGMSMVTTTVHDDYFMFIKLNFKMPVSPTDRDAATKAELELRKRQARAIELFREQVPGCRKAFIARTSPSLCIRRGRLISCDYDISLPDVLDGKHFDDDVMVYGFHDSAPRLQIKGGGTYGIPYRALRVAGIDNLLAAGMMITSDHDAHMSTRNTVCCMGQGQATGTAAALCAERSCGTRELPYVDLRRALKASDVYFED